MQIFVTEPRVARALACDVAWQAARLDGFSTDAAGCVVAGGDGIDGVVATCADRAGLDAYFGLFSGNWARVSVGVSEAEVYQTDGPSAAFSERARRVEALVAQDVMRLLAHPTDVNTPINRTGLVMRARSHLQAVDTAAPVGLRKGFSIEDVEVVDYQLPYSKYFDVADIELRHTQFDGGQTSTMSRAVLRSADAVTVLPYDPVLDQVVLVEQFRPAAFVRGDTHPWVLEPVAGRCDGDEPVERVAEREVMEEAGLTLLSLESVGSYYPSPGCLSEYLYTFVGLVDLSAAQAGVHGLETEHEDIRTHFLSFDAAMGLIDSGEADNGPLLLSLYWLAANRTRLREAASRA